MKLFQTATLFLGCFFSTPVTEALSKTNVDQYHLLDQYIGNTMWTFGKTGLYVFSPDGKEQKNHLPGDKVCRNVGGTDLKSYEVCRFYDVVSDGKKYVWAAVDRGVPKIDVFDINTGSIAGSFQTCMSPNDLEYHALRDEIWVRCYASDNDSNSDKPTKLDVFSASSPNVEIQTNILLDDSISGAKVTSEGNSVIHHTLGDYGFVTDATLPNLFKIDLSEKKLLSQFNLDPKVYALNSAVYSPVNKHVYVRSQVCCTCGSEDSDVSKCNDGDKANVTITTGQNAGLTNVTGMCGRRCEGVKNVDIIGVIEFDTSTEKVVGSHLMKEGVGGDPYPSPDGKHVIMMGRNGGRTIRVLQPDEDPAFPSRRLVDIELNFNRTGYESTSVMKDFAFVEMDGRTKIVFASGTSHKIAVVDMTNADTKEGVSISYFTFNTDTFVAGRAPHGRYRQVEWAVGTDYVWVSDNDLDEIYIIDVRKLELSKTIVGVHTRTLVSVQNYESFFQAKMQQKLIQSTTSHLRNGEDGSSKTVQNAALAIACAALVVGIANLAFMAMMKKKIGTAVPPKDIDAPSLQ